MLKNIWKGPCSHDPIDEYYAFHIWLYPENKERKISKCRIWSCLDFLSDWTNNEEETYIHDSKQTETFLSYVMGKGMIWQQETYVSDFKQELIISIG